MKEYRITIDTETEGESYFETSDGIVMRAPSLEKAIIALVKIEGVCRTPEPEKPARKIDGDEYKKWVVHDDTPDFTIDVMFPGAVYNIKQANCEGGHIALEAYSIEVAKLIAAAPGAIRAMIDFVNEWQLQSGWATKYVDRFVSIIVNAGFGSDIKQG